MTGTPFVLPANDRTVIISWIMPECRRVGGRGMGVQVYRQALDSS